MVVLHGTGDEEELPLLDHPVEERLARPGALDDARGILEHRAKDPEPPSRRHHGLGDDVAHDGHLFPHVGFGDGRNARGVQVAVRDVIQ
jgi:hypothetical protein